MQGIRAVFFAASSIAALALLALFTASLTIALFGAVAVLSMARVVSAKLKPVPVRAERRTGPQAGPQAGRIWNDGRGKIIDL